MCATHPFNACSLFSSATTLNTSKGPSLPTASATSITTGFEFPVELTSQVNDLIRCTVKIPASPSFCRDHFPSRPLLPAYAILFCIRQTLLHTLNLAPLSWSWQQLKFLRPIVPDTLLTLEIIPGDPAIQIKLRHQGDVCFSGRFVTPCNPL